jgi:hypothetical protein
MCINILKNPVSRTKTSINKIYIPSHEKTKQSLEKNHNIHCIYRNKYIIRFFCNAQHPYWLWGSPRILSNGYQAFSAKVKNGGAIPPIPHISS